MINEKIFQNIYDELDRYLMPKWEKLVIYLEFGKASYSFSFYVKVGNEFIKCYDIPNVSENDIMASFRKINELVDAERKKNNEEWTNMTITIEKSGKMHADMDYTDLSDDTYLFKKYWKTKYLN